jgi:arabinogalactan oligomer/maltooligosaccharide transport system permease protein
VSHTIEAPPETPREARAARRGTGTTTTLPLVAKVLALGLIAGIAVVLVPPLIATQRWALLIGFAVVVAVVVGIYATGRAIPAKYLLPGTLFLVLFLVYPIILTFQLSTTNYGDGTRTDKESTIAKILGSAAFQEEGARIFTLSVGTTGTVDTGPFTFFLVDPATGDAYSGTEDGLVELDSGAVEINDQNAVTAADGYTILTKSEINDATQGGGPLDGFSVPTGEAGVIKAQGFQAIELTTPLTYDEATDTITDSRTGTTYTPVRVGDRSYFTSEDGTRLSTQSWGESIGFDNYRRIFTDQRISQDFLKIFAWTLVFAVGSVASTFILGLVLAVALNDSRLRGQKFYRSILLLPYAIPGFISLLIWSGFFNTDFGLINNLLGLDINWLGNATTAKIAVLLANLWMGFPYMFLVATGALQAVPSELKEAASIDGASGFTQFRTVTFPLVLVSVAPLLVSSFAFNFNNFNAIQLLTEGGPFTPANPTAGGTDILISYTFRLAFGTSAQAIGFASAISVILFILTGVLAAIQFRATRALEDVN